MQHPQNTKKWPVQVQARQATCQNPKPTKTKVRENRVSLSSKQERKCQAGSSSSLCVSGVLILLLRMETVGP